MAWIEPLNLETWLVNVFAGTPIIFGAIALFAIATMAAYFRMNALNLFLMLGIFVLMFSEYLDGGIVLVFSLVAGVAVGMVLTRILK